ncbi:hypothetical protein MRX96_019826 [Rhipicephalus microplus]
MKLKIPRQVDSNTSSSASCCRFVNTVIFALANAPGSPLAPQHLLVEEEWCPGLHQPRSTYDALKDVQDQELLVEAPQHICAIMASRSGFVLEHEQDSQQDSNHCPCVVRARVEAGAVLGLTGVGYCR